MNGEFPRTYEAIRELAGIGDYTAAAVSSIAFGLPHAALDGNVMRVLSRLTNNPSDIGAGSTRREMQEAADALVDPKRPGDFNQAVMELGATVCLPRDPQCLLCPLAELCVARAKGAQKELPVKLRRTVPVKLERTLLIVEQKGRFLFWRRSEGERRLAGFWELPEPEHLTRVEIGERLGEFRHTITHHHYTFEVRPARLLRSCKKVVNSAWMGPKELENRPISTVARKAILMFSSRL
jgi:A/G-specific adenine glycosylase